VEKYLNGKLTKCRRARKRNRECMNKMLTENEAFRTRRNRENISRTTIIDQKRMQ